MISFPTHTQRTYLPPARPESMCGTQSSDRNDYFRLSKKEIKRLQRETRERIPSPAAVSLKEKNYGKNVLAWTFLGSCDFSPARLFSRTSVEHTCQRRRGRHAWLHLRTARNTSSEYVPKMAEKSPNVVEYAAKSIYIFPALCSFPLTKKKKEMPLPAESIVASRFKRPMFFDVLAA